jgi:predicted Zn-dependent protease
MVNRRRFLAVGCTCGASLVSGSVFAQAASLQTWQWPQRFQRPDIATDEGGLWSMMDREETRLRRSPFSLRDRELNDYVRGIACRLAGDHCPDIRVHLVNTPLFNANVAPNGMMQVWTGLMLRVDNEAQLAAVLGHEIGHYLARHSLERLRDVKTRSAFAQFLGMFGLVGVIGQLGVLAGSFAYSRDHEREADRIGLNLMQRAGYAAVEAAKVWENLLLELKAKPGGDPTRTNPLFATHPAAEERMETLRSLANGAPDGETNEATWQLQTARFRREWLYDEVKRGQHEESLALLTRKIAVAPGQPEFLYARAEIYRSRAAQNDLDAAMNDYRAAVQGGGPAESHRGMGMVYRVRNLAPEARTSFQRYLELLPDAPDVPMIKTFVEELAR